MGNPVVTTIAVKVGPYHVVSQVIGATCGGTLVLSPVAFEATREDEAGQRHWVSFYGLHEKVQEQIRSEVLRVSYEELHKWNRIPTMG